jgi:F-type H+-transporting ATPase subunit b
LKGGEILERLFNLDPQLLHDAVLLAIAIFVMFTLLSYLLFNPARDFLKKREERVKDNIDSAQKAKEDAEKLRAEYEEKLHNIHLEENEILSAARKKALENETKIIEEAKAEAAAIIERGNKQTELAVKKAQDDIKKEIISVAAMIAEKVVSENIDLTIQDSLIDDTLKEIGDQTWLS